MLRKFQKTLSVGLSGLLALGFGIGVANASGTAAQRASNVLHEMVPHVVLPETIQYNKTAKNAPGTGYTGVNSPYVADYVAYPSYQVPHTTAFRQVGQSVYPVSPPLLPAPLPPELPQSDAAAEENLAWQETDAQDTDGKDIVLTNNKMVEPIRLASVSAGTVPALPMANSAITQTGIFCQHPAEPPSAWAFSSPLFKVASVPAGWGGQAGGIVHNSPRGSMQHVGFQPVDSVDPAMGSTVPQGMPYSTFQMGRNTEPQAPQVQVLPNGMVLLTMPPSHHNCGLIRCRAGCTPRMVLLPPAGYGFPQMPQGMAPPTSPTAMMPGDFGAPYMTVSQQPQMMPPMPVQMPMSMQMPTQMQTIPVTTMTPMGPALVGYQQVPMANPMANMNPMAMMNPMWSPQMQELQQMQQMQQLQQQIQMAVAMPNPAVASQVTGAAAEGGNDALQSSALMGSAEAANPMAVVVTPFGYAIQVPANALQADAAAQLAQMQQALVQQQMQQMPMPMQVPMQMPTNPYAGLYATPFGYIAMNQSAGQFGSFGQPTMMNVGYQPMGMSMPGQGMSVSDMLQIMAFINSNKPQQRRARLADRIAERRDARKEAAACNDPFTQLMQAWTTPFVAPDTTLRMPARNAYPYGYFGVQASPISTANYGGYNNLYLGNTTYPGLY